MSGTPTTVSEIDHEGKRIKCADSEDWVPMDEQIRLQVMEDGVLLYGYLAGPRRPDGSGWIVGQYLLSEDGTEAEPVAGTVQ